MNLLIVEWVAQTRTTQRIVQLTSFGMMPSYLVLPIGQDNIIKRNLKN
jgi:hypothetical protein